MNLSIRMIPSSHIQYFKVETVFHLKSFKGPSKLPLAEIQAHQVPFPLSFYFILIVLWPFLCHLNACLIAEALFCEELALISQVLSTGNQWSWRKIRVSKFATSLLMFHLTQHCMKGLWQDQLLSTKVIEASQKCDAALHEACEVSGFWVPQTSYFSSLSFGMQILTPGAMNCTQVRWLSKGKRLQRLVVLLQGNPCFSCCSLSKSQQF